MEKKRYHYPPSSSSARPLVDGCNDSFAGGDMWLAPHTAGAAARVYVTFDEPVALSLIRQGKPGFCKLHEFYFKPEFY